MPVPSLDNLAGTDPAGNRIFIAGRDSAQDSINQLSQEMTRRNMNIQPPLADQINRLFLRSLVTTLGCYYRRLSLP